jgi:hypothetical protein
VGSLPFRIARERQSSTLCFRSLPVFVAASTVDRAGRREISIAALVLANGDSAAIGAGQRTST